MTENSEALMIAIREVGAGGFYFNPAMREARHSKNGDRPSIDQLLSVTEMQVFAVIGDGADDNKASYLLGLSAKTVHSHRQRIMRKLNVQSRGELMREAIQRGVVRFTTDHVFRPGLKGVLAGRRVSSRDAFGPISG